MNPFPRAEIFWAASGVVRRGCVLLDVFLADGDIALRAVCLPRWRYSSSSRGCQVASPSTYRLYMQNAAAMSTVS